MRFLFVFIALSAVLSLSGNDAVPTKSPEIPAITPLWPAVVAYAATHKIAIDGIDVPEPSNVGRAGDTITALVNYREGNRTKQWLIQFRIATPTDKEIADHPSRTLNLNIANGRTYQFETGATLALDISTVGPFLANQDSPSAEKQARVFICPAFLGLGLDRFCQLMLKWLEAQALAKAAAKDSSTVEKVPVTLSEEDEKIFAGNFPALIAFTESVQNTPGLREILWAVADKPSVWSIVKEGGKVNTNLNMGNEVATADISDWNFPGRQAYRMSLAIALNEKPALRCTLVVVSPHPPLLTTAGVIGIAAEPPGNSDKRLEVRVIAARRSGR